MLLDLSKAVGEVRRKLHRRILYTTGGPEELLKIIINAHINTMICARHIGSFANFVNSNDGVFKELR